MSKQTRLERIARSIATGETGLDGGEHYGNDHDTFATFVVARARALEKALDAEEGWEKVDGEDLEELRTALRQAVNTVNIAAEQFAELDKILGVRPGELLADAARRVTKKPQTDTLTDKNVEDLMREADERLVKAPGPDMVGRLAAALREVLKRAETAKRDVDIYKANGDSVRRSMCLAITHLRALVEDVRADDPDRTFPAERAARAFLDGHVVPIHAVEARVQPTEDDITRAASLPEIDRALADREKKGRDDARAEITTSLVEAVNKLRIAPAWVYTSPEQAIDRIVAWGEQKSKAHDDVVHPRDEDLDDEARTVFFSLNVPEAEMSPLEALRSAYKRGARREGRR